MESVGLETGLRRLLNVGSGGDPLPHWLSHFEDVRLDIDPSHSPDILADMRNMGEIGQFDVVYSSHSLEHLYPHEVSKALREFYRVLKPGGIVVIFVPDLAGVVPDDRVLFVSPAGPVSGLDIFYGFRPMLEKNPHMAHKMGFVSETLLSFLENANFQNVQVKKLDCYNLMGVGAKP